MGVFESLCIDYFSIKITYDFFFSCNIHFVHLGELLVWIQSTACGFILFRTLGGIHLYAFAISSEHSREPVCVNPDMKIIIIPWQEHRINIHSYIDVPMEDKVSQRKAQHPLAEWQTMLIPLDNAQKVHKLFVYRQHSTPA